MLLLDIWYEESGCQEYDLSDFKAVIYDYYGPFHCWFQGGHSIREASGHLLSQKTGHPNHTRRTGWACWTIQIKVCRRWNNLPDCPRNCSKPSFHSTSLWAARRQEDGLKFPFLPANVEFQVFAFLKVCRPRFDQLMSDGDKRSFQIHSRHLEHLWVTDCPYYWTAFTLEVSQ